LRDRVPRAAFYTEKVAKKQNKNAPIASAVRKYFQLCFQRSER
jgi:hypothetical protein